MNVRRRQGLPFVLKKGVGPNAGRPQRPQGTDGLCFGKFPRTNVTPLYLGIGRAPPQLWGIWQA